MTQPAAPEAPEPPPPARRLSARGRAWRALAVTAGTLLVINGSVFGNDVYWPFGPMSQFAFRVGTNDAIRSTFLAAVDADGRLQRVSISPHNLGIARAEIEGQQTRFVRDPGLLSTLAGNYHERHPDAPGLTQLWLGQEVTKLHNGRDAGTSVETVVGWPRNTLIPPSLPGPGGATIPVDLDAPENSQKNTGADNGETGQEGRK